MQKILKSKKITLLITIILKELNLNVKEEFNERYAVSEQKQKLSK